MTRSSKKRKRDAMAASSSKQITISASSIVADVSSSKKNSKKKKHKNNNKGINGQSSGGDISTNNDIDDTTTTLEATKNNTSEEGGNRSMMKTSSSSSNDTSTKSKKKPTTKPKPSALQQSFIERLRGSRFRLLNEELYTSPSSEAYVKYQEHPELFQQYHDGFASQVKTWSINPLDLIQRWIVQYYYTEQTRRRRPQGQPLVVADFGCGEAKLAETLLKIKVDVGSTITIAGDNKEGEKDEECSPPPPKKKRRNKKKNGSALDDRPTEQKHETQQQGSSICPFEVHSFDLVSNNNPLITACDMSNVPLPDKSVDIGVFCLALMGTNVQDFVKEAHRVLRQNGVLKVAEVRSRFESATPYAPIQHTNSTKGGKFKHNTKKKKGAEVSTTTKKVMNDKLLNEFLTMMKHIGFRSTKVDRTNPFFVLMDFQKVPVSSVTKTTAAATTFTPKPCLYKRR